MSLGWGWGGGGCDRTAARRAPPGAHNPCLPCDERTRATVGRCDVRGQCKGCASPHARDCCLGVLPLRGRCKSPRGEGLQSDGLALLRESTVAPALSWTTANFGCRQPTAQQTRCPVRGNVIGLYPNGTRIARTTVQRNTDVVGRRRRLHIQRDANRPHTPPPPPEPQHDHRQPTGWSGIAVPRPGVTVWQIAGRRPPARCTRCTRACADGCSHEP